MFLPHAVPIPSAPALRRLGSWRTIATVIERARLFVWSVVIVLSGSGCDRDRSTSAASTAEPTASARPSCEGREVVALVAGPRVLRGTVEACAGPRLTIAYGHPLKSKPRPERQVEATSTWDVGEPAEAAVGDVGVCHYGRDLWKLCKVTAAEGGRFRVASPEGLVREIDATEMVALEGAATKTVADHFADRERERTFDEAVLAATFHHGSPNIGERVVAPRVGATFYEASVVAIDGDEVRVRWSNATWPERRVPRRHVGRPVAANDAQAPLEPGRLVLWRKKGSEARFEPARVVATGSDWTLRDRAGVAQTVAANDIEVVIAIDAKPP